MKIPVRLISIDAPPPPGFDDAGEGAVELDHGASLADALRRLGLPADEPYATLVNGEPVAAGERRRRRLAAGDQLTLFPPIKGGRGHAGRGQGGRGVRRP